jgi:leader peptidase (prepilin peptidase)/N-methyltransferase
MAVAGIWRLAQVFALLFGACVGSFLNVVIARVPEGLSIVHPPSRCPKCLAPIRWFDNIPVLSWLLLRGRCRGCSAPISARYPAVELLTGLLALALVQRFGLGLRAPVCFVLVALLVAITYIDVDHWIIPHALTWPGIVFGLATSFVDPGRTPLESLLGALGGFFGFAAVAWLAAKAFRKEALGQGDWWLLGMIGAFLGYQALLPVVLLASVQGSVLGILLLLVGRSEPGTAEHATPESAKPETSEPETSEPASAPEPATPPSEADSPAAAGNDAVDEEDDWVPPRNAVPFGPFLALGALEQLFFGDVLYGLYDRLLVHLIA